MSALTLPAVLRDWMAAEARRAFPRECCGLLEGTRMGEQITVVGAHAAHNLFGQPDRFEIDPEDHFRILCASRQHGNAIVGCYHSHPSGTPRPSLLDREGAGEADYVWLIVAATPQDGAEIGAYIFDGNGFLPLGLAD